MSSVNKRDAEQAFGKDLADVGEQKRKKKSRSKRHKPERSVARESGLNGVHAGVKSLKLVSDLPTKTLPTVAQERETTPPNPGLQDNLKDDGSKDADKKLRRKRKTRSRTEPQERHRNSDDVLPINTELQPVKPGPGLELLTQSHLTALESVQDHTGAHTELSKKQKKKQRKAERERLLLQNSQTLIVQGIEDSMDQQQQQPSPNINQKKKKSRSRSEQSLNQWHLTSPCGGAFIEQDPILTIDGEHLIAGMGQNVNVYAIKTSLLIRSISCTTRSAITSCIQSQVEQRYVYAGLADGRILKIDWTVSGSPLWATRFNEPIFSMIDASVNSEQDVLLVAHGHNAAERDLTKVTVDANKQIGHEAVLQDRGIMHQMWGSSQEGLLLIAGSRSLSIGRKDNNDGYTWQELSVPGLLSCFGSRLFKHDNSKPALSVAIGLDSGQIHIYNDVLNTKMQSLVPRKLHWHRSGPEAVKFAPDANYLISGGHETTLVIWQLDTNQQQYLPHLSTSILNITVSSLGDKYALRMADNSIMVLSTSDLKPIANMSGLSLDSITKQEWTRGLSVIAQIHPQHADRLLLACSAHALNNAMRPQEKVATTLQTYDTSAQLHLYRQALVETLTARVNVGPQSKVINPPEVTHLDITHDGKWLVTADRWQPELDDTKDLFLAEGDETGKTAQIELHLRFWNTATTSEDGHLVADGWEEGTRISQPVTDLSSCSAQRGILAVAIHPVKHQVAVADTNRHLKIYSPKARMRNGVQIRNQRGDPLFTWTCDYDLPFEEAAESNASKTASIAFSEDGSVIAASWSSVDPKRARVFLINSKTGETAASFADIVTVNQSRLAFHGQYLVALSKKLCVFDTVTSQAIFELELDAKYEHTKSLMAVDVSTGIVAIAVSSRAAHLPSQLVLFQIGETIKLLLDTKASGQVVVLKTIPSNGEFLIIDSEARMSKISPPGSSALVVLDSSATENKQIATTRLSNIFGEGRSVPVTSVPAQQHLLEGPEQLRSLEEVLNFDSTARAPSSRDLFHRVVQVVAGIGA